MTFPHCVSLDVSSNCQLERMQSHTGCICLTFLHSVFLNVFLNCLHHRMQNHIGCIYLTFLHCVFSKESSNCLPEMGHSRIGCTCLTFLLHYVCFPGEYIHWPHFHLSQHLKDIDPSSPRRECCSLCNVTFKLRKWGLRIRRENKWKWESLLKTILLQDHQPQKRQWPKITTKIQVGQTKLMGSQIRYWILCCYKSRVALSI